MARTEFPKHSTSKFVLQCVLSIAHTYVYGPMQVESMCSFRYFATFIDKTSHQTAVYSIKRNSDDFQTLQNYILFADRETGKRIKLLFSDGGDEYMSNDLQNHLNARAIKHVGTCAYTPQLNGITERLNRTGLYRI